jgi:Domain of unknown function (DUF4185)
MMNELCIRMRRIISAMLLIAATGPVARPAPPDFLPPQVVKAESATEWNVKFDGKEGWIGGDGAYSVTLGPKRVLWLFGDTILGTAKDGKRSGASMVNNTIGIQNGVDKDSPIRFVSGKPKDGKPSALFVPADGKGFFWPQAALRDADRLFAFLPRIEKTKDPGAFGFKQIGQVLAVIENPDDQPEKWRTQQHNVPHVDFAEKRERSWGSALLGEDGQVYIYGFDQRKGKGGKRELTLARAPSGKLTDFTAWQFRTADGWSEKPGDAANLADGLATEFSVSRLEDAKTYVLVYTENGLSDKILGRFSPAPHGPWSAPVLLYRCPEMAKDKGVFSYAAKAHPWATNGNELVVSYCVNTWDFWQVFKDDSVYRPRFVRVTLGPAKTVERK